MAAGVGMRGLGRVRAEGKGGERCGGCGTWDSAGRGVRDTGSCGTGDTGHRVLRDRGHGIRDTGRCGTVLGRGGSVRQVVKWSFWLPPPPEPGLIRPRGGSGRSGSSRSGRAAALPWLSALP